MASGRLSSAVPGDDIAANSTACCEINPRMRLLDRPEGVAALRAGDGG